MDVLFGAKSFVTKETAYGSICFFFAKKNTIFLREIKPFNEENSVISFY